MAVAGLVVSSLACLGASCDGGRKPGAQAAAPSSESAATGELVEELPGIDTSELTDAEIETWVALVNGQLSPCGDPITVARCVAEKHRCGACVTAARYLTRLVMEGYDRATIEQHFNKRFDKSVRHDIDIDGAPILGAPMAPVTIVEFSDFQCPFCSAAAPELKRLLREHEGKIKLVFKHFPLSGHPRAVHAARAAEAAGRQGKFWEMHDLLFQNQRALSDADFVHYARTLGLDVERFQADYESEELRAEVEADRKQGEQLKVEATPTLFINGRHFDEPLKALDAYLAEEMEL